VTADIQHYAWLARSFGRTDELLLTPDDLRAIATIGEVVTKYPGTHLFKEGEDADAAYVIQSGEAELYRGDKAQGKVVTRVGEGAVLGDIAMFKGDPYLSSARAVDHLSALRLERTELLPLLLQRPMIALRWLVAGLDQLERTQRRVLSLMQRTIPQQVGDLLLDEADRNGEVHLAQGTIATLLGASRQSVNEALAEMKAGGAIETGYRLIRIIDRDTVATTAGRS
jgi:CRP-like cAMP-binding protein